MKIRRTNGRDTGEKTEGLMEAWENRNDESVLT
jgi:hypothetical protein